MADGDTRVEKFANLAHAHTTAGAETVLTIPTRSNVHYDLLVNVVTHDDGVNDRNGWLLHLLIENDGGTLTANSSTLDTLDPVTSGYTVSVTTSGTNVLVQVTAVSGVRSAAYAHGIAMEQAFGA